ncbi:MAG TPA: 30S ribosomal protein S16 [Phycisphaerae bacterium]|nr:30S ribosomal protein S16 [Phycisphaerae bacterium]HRR86303.1 30S ribosomal protein S16 [Phycisphaerae bacterium]
MVRLRLKRTGRRHRPTYRLAAVDSRSPRDGMVIEELGVYEPANQNPDLRCKLKQERVEYWLKVGARPSDTARDLLKRLGYQVSVRK